EEKAAPVHASRYALVFFSSRRRHTRFDCDWSSDVCSSDLGVHFVSPTSGSLLAASWVLVPLVGDTKWTPRSEYYQGTFFNDSYEIGRASCRERGGGRLVRGRRQARVSPACRAGGW